MIGDSSLIINTLRSEGGISSPQITRIIHRIKVSSKKFEKIAYCHVLQSSNPIADQIVNAEVSLGGRKLQEWHAEGPVLQLNFTHERHHTSCFDEGLV